MVLTHGIEKNVWMMQYQYADEQGNGFEGDGPAQITKNWRRLEEIQVGDQFAAYLPRNTFYATGTVIKPRKAMDIRGTVEEYLKSKRSHNHKKGVVYYTPVFYEDFSDKWRAPDDNSTRWPQRIDVEDWTHFVPNGVVVKGLIRFVPMSFKWRCLKSSRNCLTGFPKGWPPKPLTIQQLRRL